MASPFRCSCPPSGSTRVRTTSSPSSRCSSAASTASTGCCSAISSTLLGSKGAAKDSQAFAQKLGIERLTPVRHRVERRGQGISQCAFLDVGGAADEVLVTHPRPVHLDDAEEVGDDDVR